MNEQERLLAINKMMDWRHDDETVKVIILEVLRATGQASLGHLARFDPDAFDELYDECGAMVENVSDKDRN